MNRVIASISRYTDVEAKLQSYLDVAAEVALYRVDATMETYEPSVTSSVPANVFVRSDGASYFLRPDGTSYYVRP